MCGSLLDVAISRRMNCDLRSSSAAISESLGVCDEVAIGRFIGCKFARYRFVSLETLYYGEQLQPYLVNSEKDSVGEFDHVTFLREPSIGTEVGCSTR